MGVFLNLISKRFGRLIVENKAALRSSNGTVRWNCVCDCGNKTTVNSSHLVAGYTVSCGCLQREAVTRHGLSDIPEYNVWNGMIQRCTNTNDKRFSDYGGRGITVCDRWLNSIHNFIEDMGFRPSSDHSIDRKENDKGYYKDNCHWATCQEQSNNRRSNIFYHYKGQQYTIPKLSRLPEAIQNDVCESTLVKRIKHLGWSVENAINTPARKVTIPFYTNNDITKTITEWATKYGIEYNKLYNRLVKLKWDFERAVNIP